jgi:hypothetical protein
MVLDIDAAGDAYEYSIRMWCFNVFSLYISNCAFFSFFLQVGGEGLAAHTELYPYLHPSYLEDAERLRKTVFGKLKAKGGFSGKALAGIMPLLVHYVNEDFPLNAERKMRDVLTDIVIDGAFSGGAQYFQMAMQNPTLLPGARGKGGDPVLAKLERNASLKALAVTAFTSKELEDIMNSAGIAEVDPLPCVFMLMQKLHTVYLYLIMGYGTLSET